VRTTLLNGFLLHDHWQTFTSSDGSSNFFSSIGVIRRFEGVTSSAMTESLLASTKTKGGVETIWYLHLEGVDAFI
jgi:hypothetical protein